MTCSACYQPIAEDALVVILTENTTDFNHGWGGVICHVACAGSMNWTRAAETSWIARTRVLGDNA